MNYTPAFRVIEEIKSSERTLVVFSAKWCGPCKAMYPILDNALENGTRIFMINIDEDRDYANQNRINSVPTCILFEGNNILKRNSGNFKSPNDFANFMT
jgi:thioredoxin 1